MILKFVAINYVLSQLKLHRTVINHENIIQFYGITKKKKGKY
jgi:hypothetical protein